VAGDAVRLAHRVDGVTGLIGDYVAVDLVGGAAVEFEIAREGCDISARLIERFADISAFKLRQFLRIGLHGVAKAGEPATALHGAQRAPGAVECAARRGDGFVDIRRAAGGDFAKHLAVGRVLHRQRPGARRGTPAAADMQIMSLEAHASGLARPADKPKPRWRSVGDRLRKFAHGTRRASMADETILQVLEADGLARVTMNRPDRLNALNQPMADALLAYFESKRRDAGTRVIVLTGAGRAFCSGADLKAAGTPERLRDGPNGDWVLRDLMKAMRACPQPIIACVKGAAAGGGLALALASDIILAGESAAFHPAFSKIGLSGSELGVSWRLQRLIGAARARLMLYTGRPMRAAEALAAGLVSAVVADDALDAEGASVAAELLAMAPDALRITKRTFDATLEAASFDTALEIEERGQIQMIRQNAAARGGS